jgi:hypothetical protein
MTGVDASPRPEEPDVHLSVFLHGARLDFDHQARHHADAMNVIPGDTTGLRRLPCERLFLEP